ncbi:MAG: AAA family ATPase [Bauldia sp.]
MLRTLKINRFKSIHDQSIDFGAVNLFIGANGSGKSNLLEAIGIVSAALERGITDSDLARKGVRLSTPALFKSAFKNDKLPRTLQLSAYFDRQVTYSFELTARDSDTSLRFNTEKIKLSDATLFGRSGNGATAMGTSLTQRPNERRSVWDQTRSVHQVPIEVPLELDALAGYAIYSPQTAFLRGEEVGTVQSPPIGLHGEGLPQAVLTLLRKFPTETKENQSLYTDVWSLVWLPGWARQFRVGPVDPILTSSRSKTGSETLYFLDKFMHSKRNTLSAYDSSEGTLFLLFVVTLLLHPDSPDIFALDNVDNALDPKMTRLVIEKIIRATVDPVFEDAGLGPRQVFMTSHNPTAADAFDLFDDRNRIFVVKRQDGRTVVNRLKPPDGMTKEEWITLRAGRSLSELWIEGQIPDALG